MKKLAILAGLTVVASAANAQVLFTGNYTQNFDTLANSGSTNTWTDNSTLTGWYSNRVVYRASTGSDNAGAIYSNGAAASNERSLGTIASGSASPVFGVRLVNNTGSTITSLDVAFTQENWRSSTSVANIIDFAYAVGVTSLSDAGYTDFNGLDLVGPDPVTSNGALDGNLAANQVAKSSTLGSLNWTAGQSLWLRWTDFNDVGNDADLAIDNLSATSQPVPEPATMIALACGASAFIARRRRK